MLDEVAYADKCTVMPSPNSMETHITHDKILFRKIRSKDRNQRTTLILKQNYEEVIV